MQEKFWQEHLNKNPLERNLHMIYWKGEKFWVGKLLAHPEIMTQGKTLGLTQK